MLRSRKNILKQPRSAITIGASVTAQVISSGENGDGFPLLYGMAGRIDVGLGAVTKGSGVTFLFQTASCRNLAGTGWIDWQDVASATVPADSVPETAVTIFWNTGISGAQAAKLPCGLVGRVVCTTAAGASVLINSLALTETT